MIFGIVLSVLCCELCVAPAWIGSPVSSLQAIQTRHEILSYIWINCFTAHSRALLQNGQNVRHLSDFNYHETLSLGRVWWHLWKYTEREKTSKMAWKSFESFSQKILNPLVTTMGREKGRLEHLTKIIQISITFCKLLSFTGLLSFCWAQQLCCCVFDFDSIFALMRASLSSYNDEYSKKLNRMNGKLD